MFPPVGPKVSDEETEACISWASNQEASIIKKNKALESVSSSPLPVQGLGSI